jgi:hypothetical protein
MSTISEKYGLQSNDDDGMSPVWGVDPNGIPFSKRNQSDLYSTYLIIEQKNFGDITKKVREDRTVSPRIKTTLDTLYIPQSNRDGVLAAIHPYQAAKILCNKKLEILKALAASSPREANNPRVRAAIVAYDESMDYFLSKNQRDQYNERQNIKEEKILFRQDIRQSRLEDEQVAQKRGGVLGMLRGGKQ